MQERDSRKRERESKTLLRFAAQPDRQPRLPTWVPLSLYLPCRRQIEIVAVLELKKAAVLDNKAGNLKFICTTLLHRSDVHQPNQFTTSYLC